MEEGGGTAPGSFWSLLKKTLPRKNTNPVLGQNEEKQKLD